jgi:ABC-2 type transport system permease protein
VTSLQDNIVTRKNWLHDVRLVIHQTKFEQLFFWLNRVGAIFTVGFSVVFLVLLGASAGNQRVASLGGIRLVQYYVPGFIAYGVMAAGFTTLAITIVVRRETGLLKRLRLSPLPAWVLIASIFISTTIVALVQTCLLLVIGRFGYHVNFPTSWSAMFFAILLGIMSFSAMGVAISSVVPNQEAAGPVTSIVFFVLLFLAGLWFPLPPGSGLAKFSNYLPVRHLMIAMDRSFEIPKGVSPWAWHDLLVIGLWGVGATLVSLRRFRWSPRRT